MKPIRALVIAAGLFAVGCVPGLSQGLMVPEDFAGTGSSDPVSLVETSQNSAASPSALRPDPELRQVLIR